MSEGEIARITAIIKELTQRLNPQSRVEEEDPLESAGTSFALGTAKLANDSMRGRPLGVLYNPQSDSFVPVALTGKVISRDGEGLRVATARISIVTPDNLKEILGSEPAGSLFTKEGDPDAITEVSDLLVPEQDIVIVTTEEELARSGLLVDGNPITPDLKIEFKKLVEEGPKDVVEARKLTALSQLFLEKGGEEDRELAKAGLERVTEFLMSQESSGSDTKELLKEMRDLLIKKIPLILVQNKWILGGLIFTVLMASLANVAWRSSKFAGAAVVQSMRRSALKLSRI